MPDVLDVGEQLAALSRDGHAFGEIFRSPAGSLSLTVAGDDHRFVDITEDLGVLVFWSPARYGNAPAAG
ncbi:MAG TPA: hypothetical protein VJY85_11475 [Candidatus Limnocylindria bacterium]|nr:hypothetical protein [Candidatus Limnocylindria bacterium]